MTTAIQGRQTGLISQPAMRTACVVAISVATGAIMYLEEPLSHIAPGLAQRVHPETATDRSVLLRRSVTGAVIAGLVTYGGSLFFDWVGRRCWEYLVRKYAPQN